MLQCSICGVTGIDIGNALHMVNTYDKTGALLDLRYGLCDRCYSMYEVLLRVRDYDSALDALKSLTTRARENTP